MTPEDAKNKIAELTQLQTATQLQLEGTRKLFDASLLMEDAAGADRYRAQLHDLLDKTLDTQSSLFSIICFSSKM